MDSPPLLRLFDGRARCELAFAGPFALLAGGLYGIQLSSLPAVWLVCSLVLGLFVAAQIALEGAVVERFGGDRGQWGPAVAFLWDAFTGAIVGFPVFWLLDLPAGPAVGAAASFGAFYGWFMGYAVCGGATESLVGVLLQGGAKLRTSDHSYPLSLEARGDPHGAVAAWTDALAQYPRDPAPYFALARLQAGPLETPEEALRTVRQALQDAMLDERQTILALRRILDLHEALGRPAAGITELARYLDKAEREGEREGEAVRWATDTIRRMKGKLHHDYYGTPLEEPNGQADPDR